MGIIVLLPILNHPSTVRLINVGKIPGIENT
jgi:hypothetical protein